MKKCDSLEDENSVLLDFSLLEISYFVGCTRKMSKLLCLVWVEDKLFWVVWFEDELSYCKLQLELFGFPVLLLLFQFALTSKIPYCWGKWWLGISQRKKNYGARKFPKQLPHKVNSFIHKTEIFLQFWKLTVGQNKYLWATLLILVA